MELAVFGLSSGGWRDECVAIPARRELELSYRAPCHLQGSHRSRTVGEKRTNRALPSGTAAVHRRNLWVDRLRRRPQSVPTRRAPVETEHRTSLRAGQPASHPASPPDSCGTEDGRPPLVQTPRAVHIFPAILPEAALECRHPAGSYSLRAARQQATPAVEQSSRRIEHLHGARTSRCPTGPRDGALPAVYTDFLRLLRAIRISKV